MKKSESEVAQSCPTLCHPVDCTLPGSSVHGIFQARVREWVAISFSFCCWQQNVILGFYRISWKVIKLVAQSLALLPRKSPLLTRKEKCKMWQIMGRGQHRHMTGKKTVVSTVWASLLLTTVIQWLMKSLNPMFTQWVSFPISFPFQWLWYNSKACPNISKNRFFCTFVLDTLKCYT